MSDKYLGWLYNKVMQAHFTSRRQFVHFIAWIRMLKPYQCVDEYLLPKQHLFQFVSCMLRHGG